MRCRDCHLAGVGSEPGPEKSVIRGPAHVLQLVVQSAHIQCADWQACRLSEGFLK